MFNLRERHFTVIELATLWNVHPDTVRRIFAEEPGVIKISRRTSSHDRPPRENGHRPRVWVQLRIPESVAERVYRRLTENPSYPPKKPPTSTRLVKNERGGER
jgi:hypothetical protein